LVFEVMRVFERGLDEEAEENRIAAKEKMTKERSLKRAKKREMC
jgi:hypothetical protein